MHVFRHHPSISNGTVTQAYEAAMQLHRTLRLDSERSPTTTPSGAIAKLLKYYRPQPFKAQLQVPFEDPEAFSQLPAKVQSVAFGLRDCTLQFSHEVITQCVPSAADALNGATAVLRVWMYSPLPPRGGNNNGGETHSNDNRGMILVGSNVTGQTEMTWNAQGENIDANLWCRAHQDPGICTALLLGSQHGLQLWDDAKRQWHSASTHTKCDHPRGCGRQRPEEEEEEEAPVLVLAGTTMSCLTAGRVGAAVHRVVSEEQSLHERVNLIVEVRPKRNAWYSFVPQEAEATRLEKWLREGLTKM